MFCFNAKYVFHYNLLNPWLFILPENKISLFLCVGIKAIAPTNEFITKSDRLYKGYSE
ncbi:MAG: hypothetical protein V7K92_12000 [Nostoc sp.]|uniref:hypothetical protein n=1 Tax=Nostoc sp. TaxID=1180 RepID=UPI002FF330B0